MAGPDIKKDAKRVFEVLKAGGTAIVPASAGYTIMSDNSKSLKRIFMTKKRGAHKRHGMSGSYALHKRLHVIDQKHADTVHTLTQTFGLTLGVVAKVNDSDPIVQNLDEDTLEAASNEETMAMLIGAGTLHDEITNLTAAENMLILGSSANLTGTGKWPESLGVLATDQVRRNQISC